MGEAGDAAEIGRARIGESVCKPASRDARPLRARRAQAGIIKRLPLGARRKPTLDLLAKFLSASPGDITVHTLDLDLLLVDNASPAASGQNESAPICFVTQGLIRESLFWGTGAAYDVEETACKSHGHHACEFKITAGK